jgi:hypothetical protein
VTPTASVATASLIQSGVANPPPVDASQTWTSTIELAAIARSPSIPASRKPDEGNGVGFGLTARF